MKSIKAINTIRKTGYAIAVSGFPYAINDIKAALIEWHDGSGGDICAFKRQFS